MPFVPTPFGTAAALRAVSSADVDMMSSSTVARRIVAGTRTAQNHWAEILATHQPALNLSSNRVLSTSQFEACAAPSVNQARPDRTASITFGYVAAACNAAR